MASGKTLQSTIEISGVLSPSLQAAIKSAVDKLEEMSKETLASAGAAEKLTAEIGAQESVLKSLQKGYADYIVSGQESSDEAQTLANKIQELSGELDENRGTLQAAERAAKSLTQQQVDTADAYTKLEREINSQQSELSALRREYANVVLEQGESSDEARQLASRISDLSGELNQNKQKLSEAERAADAFGDSLEEAGQDAESSSEGFTIMKGAIADLVADGIEKAVEAFKELATEGDTALGMLEARTGATGDKMAGFEDVMYEVYNANYGDSLGDVSEKLSTVIQMTDDLDNASLAKVTKNAIALEDVFGFDVTESMRAANSLMDQFGITSDQAFNLIVQGAQNGLNQNDDLLDTINEYSVQFKNAGYSADDMFNMLSNGVESGTWSVDKLGDAVKEFNIRMSDGSAKDAVEALGFSWESVSESWSKGGDEAKDVFNMLVNELDGLENTTDGYNIGVGLLGTMYEDLGHDAVLALSNTEGAIKSTSDAMGKMDSAAYDTLESSLSQLGRTIKSEVVQPIVKKLTPTIKKAVNYVNTKVGPAVDWLLEHLPEVGIVVSTIGAVIAAAKWSSIVAQIMKIAGAVKSFVTGIVSALAGISAPVLAVIAIVAVLAAAFTNLWKNNEEFRDKITGIWEEVKGKFEAFGQTITDKLNELGFNFESFTEVLSAVWDGFCSLLAPIFEGVFQQISNILGVVLDVLVGLFDVFAGIFTGDWEMVWEGVKGIFGSVWDFIVNTFTNVLNTLKGVADTVLGWFGTNWETVWGNIKTFFSNTWNGIVSFFTETWNSIKTTATNAWNGIASFFTTAWNNIKTVFSNVWNGIVSFLSGAWETIKNVVQVGVMFVGEILSAAFQIITLPFRFIWENCKETVTAAWTAIKNTIGNAINAAKEKITTVTNTIKTVASNAWNAIKGTASTVWEGIKSTIGSKIDAAKEKIGAVTGTIKTVASNAWTAVSSAASSKWESIKNTISNKISAAKERVSAVTGTIKTVASNAWSAVSSAASSKWESIKSTISSKLNSAKSTVSSVMSGITSTMSSKLSSAFSTVSSKFSSIYSTISSKMESAKSAVSNAISALKEKFNFSWSLPNLKLPHLSISGKFSINPPSVPSFGISWYKDGGILTQPTIFGAAGNTLLAGGEAGAEAVLPLKVLWDKMEAILRRILSGHGSTGGTADEGLTSKAGELLTLDNFSLGSLADGTNVVIYYDFSNFTWSPQIQTGGTGDDEDDLMARLRAHEAEFFDWLEEFIKMREVAQYA